MSNPFKEGSTSYRDFETMSDLQWHCTKCELKSGQAKTWQVWRQEKGIQLAQDETGNFYKKQLCPHCGTVTVFRKLIATDLLPVSQARSGISAVTAKRVKALYENEEAVLLRKLSDRELEVDHRFPQIRWGENEQNNDRLSDEELKAKFMLLKRSNNLWKSRQCEKCLTTGKRGCFPGIHFWYEGGENWNSISPNDERGCIGCFWYNPYRWREEINKIIKQNS